MDSVTNCTNALTDLFHSRAKLRRSIYMKKKSNTKGIIALGITAILGILLLCGFSEGDTEKILPIGFIIGIENEEEEYRLLEEIEFELSNETPDCYYFGENADGNIILSFEDMQSGAVSLDVTISYENGDQIYSCGFVNDAIVKIELEPGAGYEIKFKRGVKDNLQGIEEIVEYTSGKVKVYVEE